MKSIEMVIDTEGGVTIEAIGFKGQGCEKATEALEKAMGTSGKKVKKPEFFQQEVGKQGVGR